MKRQHHRVVASLFGLATAALPAWSAADVNIDVDDAVRHQTIQGYGATTLSLMFGAVDNVPPALRTQAIDALYNQVRLNMGNLEIGPFESPSTMLYSPANDDSDPNTFNAAGFNWAQSDNMMNGVVSLGRPLGFTDFWIGPAQSEGFEFAWAAGLRGTNYNRYLDEAAEHIAAIAIHWRDAYGITPRYMQLWNEPTSGNTELGSATARNLTDLVIRAGARLRREGFSSMTFVVPAEETEQRSLDNATAILSDPMARPYVGAIAYHPYPYGSTYSSVPNILATSGSGTPSAAAISVRNRLRDLGAMYGIPVMMVEVSHSDLPFGDFDNMRGRAIQIHDEMVYADAAAFFGMNAMWDSETQRQHYAGRPDPGLFSETDTVVLIDDTAGRVYISEMGRAIGQYARWVPPGSVRIDATSDDSLVQVTAFRDDRDARLALVVINNATSSRTVHVNLSAIALTTANITGEQSTASGYWQSIAPFAPASTGFTVTLPARSVTSYAGTITGATPADAGVADAGSADVPTVPDAGCAGTICSGVCTNTQTDALNCGSCGNAVCHAEVCAGGVAACSVGRTACGSPFACLGCKDLRDDPMNCGACGNACATGQVCSAGMCVASCPAGTTTCGSSCVTDTQTDLANCGGCGVVCDPGRTCVAGSCVAMSTPDAGTDAAVADGASRDDVATGSDAAMDGSVSRSDAGPDASAPGTTTAGCGCRVPRGEGPSGRGTVVLAACAALVVANRRRRRSEASRNAVDVRARHDLRRALRVAFLVVTSVVTAACTGGTLPEADAMSDARADSGMPGVDVRGDGSIEPVDAGSALDGADSSSSADVITPADATSPDDAASAVDATSTTDVVAIDVSPPSDAGSIPDVATPPDAGSVSYVTGNPCLSDGTTIRVGGGSQECTISFAGASRSYRLHVPATYRAGNALVLSLHGDGGSGSSVERESQWSTLSDSTGFAVVYPNGIVPPGRSTPTWNFYFKDLGVDDSGFIRQVIAQLQSSLRPDPRRIYATGMSAGSFMTHRLGADLADVLAAIAPVNGMLYARPIGDTRVPPNPARPISVLMFLGDADAAVLYCGRVGTSATVTSSDEAFDFWRTVNGCSGALPSGTLCSGGSPTALTEHAGTGCPSGIAVQMYRLIRGVHAYYTTPMNDPAGTPYNPAFDSTTGIRTTEIIWNFFVAHPAM